MSNETYAAAKADLRKNVKAQRDALPAATRAAFSARITEKLLALPSFQAARCVSAYMSIDSEFVTREFVERVLALGKTLLLPRVDGATRRLTLHVVTDLARDLAPGTWDILEPRESIAAADLSIVDWILVPGLAFTRQGDRLGYGAGYYDRLIADITHRPALVAGAFGVQIVDDLPTLPYDCSVEVVVTEDAVFGA